MVCLMVSTIECIQKAQNQECDHLKRQYRTVLNGMPWHAMGI